MMAGKSIPLITLSQRTEMGQGGEKDEGDATSDKRNNTKNNNNNNGGGIRHRKFSSIMFMV